MPQYEFVEILVDKDGNPQIHVKGVKGKSCTGVTDPLEKALGGQVIERHFTPEYNEEPSPGQRQRKRVGE